MMGAALDTRPLSTSKPATKYGAAMRYKLVVVDEPEEPRESIEQESSGTGVEK